MVFDRREWRGKNLLNKIQLISFLIIYMALPFIMNLLKVPKDGKIPPSNIFIFVVIIILIGFMS